jgi:hypothetical protein
MADVMEKQNVAQFCQYYQQYQLISFSIFVIPQSLQLMSYSYLQKQKNY